MNKSTDTRHTPANTADIAIASSTLGSQAAKKDVNGASDKAKDDGKTGDGSKTPGTGTIRQ